MTHTNSNRFTRRKFLKGVNLAATAAVLVSFAGAAIAQEDPRLKRAKEKGKITWYSAAFPENMREALAKGFTDKTGIELSIYAGGGNQIVSRLRTERKTGAYNVDVIDGGDIDVFGGMIKDGILKAYNPKSADAIHPDFKDSQGYYYGMYFWTLLLQYNTNFYNKDTAPKSFADLIDPRFKGKVVISDPARSTAGLGFIKSMVTWKGWPWVEGFLKNEPLVISISSGIQPAVVSGERPISMQTTQFYSKNLEEGGPVALATNEFLFGSPDVVGLVTKGPNPDGAELLAEYLISKEAQQMIPGFGPYSTRTDIKPPFGMPPVTELKLKYKEAPSLDIGPTEVAERFHALLRKAKK